MLPGIMGMSCFITVLDVHSNATRQGFYSVLDQSGSHFHQLYHHHRHQCIFDILYVVDVSDWLPLSSSVLCLFAWYSLLCQVVLGAVHQTPLLSSFPSLHWHIHHHRSWLYISVYSRIWKLPVIFFSYNCPCTYGVPQCAAHRNARRAPVWLSQHLPNSQNSCGTSHTDNCLINTPYCHACF